MLYRLTISTPEGDMHWELTPEKAAQVQLLLDKLEDGEGSDIEKATKLVALLNDFQNN